MSKIIKFSLLLVLLMPMLLFYSSCKDNLDISVALEGSKEDIAAMLRSEDIVQRASIDSDNFRFESNEGTIVTAEPNSFVFREGGEVVTGVIDFELTELFTKSDILRYGIQTKTTNEILESDGEFLFSASQDGQELRLANDKALDIRVPNPDPNPGMELFVTGEGVWWPEGTPINILVIGPDTINEFMGYEFSFDRLDWVNIDYFTKFDVELIDISICLPDGYQDDNISLWIVFRDIDVVLSSSGENLPIGEVVSIVCIAAQDEDTFRIDIQEVTVEKDLKVNLEPKIESEDRIYELLKKLD